MIKGFDKFHRTATENAKHYDYIFYLPPEIPLINTGFHKLDKKFRLLVDRILLQILKEYKFSVISGSLEERLQQIEKIIVNNGDIRNIAKRPGMRTISVNGKFFSA